MCQLVCLWVYTSAFSQTAWGEPKNAIADQLVKHILTVRNTSLKILSLRAPLLRTTPPFYPTCYGLLRIDSHTPRSKSYFVMFGPLWHDCYWLFVARSLSAIWGTILVCITIEYWLSWRDLLHLLVPFGKLPFLTEKAHKVLPSYFLEIWSISCRFLRLEGLSSTNPKGSIRLTGLLFA